MSYDPKRRALPITWSSRRRSSGRALPAVSFVYLSVECPFNKFYGINCRPKLGAKLLDRFFHRRRQVSPPVNGAAHRFFDGSQHVLDCDFAVGSRHGAVASSSSRQVAEHGRPSHYRTQACSNSPPIQNGITSSVSFVSTTNTARRFAGSVSLALALTLWRSPGSSDRLCPAL